MRRANFPLEWKMDADDIWQIRGPFSRYAFYSYIYLETLLFFALRQLVGMQHGGDFLPHHGEGRTGGEAVRAFVRICICQNIGMITEPCVCCRKIGTFFSDGILNGTGTQSTYRFIYRSL